MPKVVWLNEWYPLDIDDNNGQYIEHGLKKVMANKSEIYTSISGVDTCINMSGTCNGKISWLQ
jgi:hypothetical protein